MSIVNQSTATPAPRFYSFDERLHWSDGYLDGGIATILKARIPACVDVAKAGKQDDKNGTDYWAIRSNLDRLSIDVKVRNADYAQFGEDDLALETWSVVGVKVGWTRDATKTTDYVLWYWQDTTRFFLVSFHALCKTFARYWKEWSNIYKCRRQQSDGWQSECVFVPRKVLMDKLAAWQNGNVIP
jgi:hypothetical protein